MTYVARAMKTAETVETLFMPSRLSIHASVEKTTYMNVVDDMIMADGHPPIFFASISFRALGG